VGIDEDGQLSRLGYHSHVFRLAVKQIEMRNGRGASRIGIGTTLR
jgi:hypothetical protein